MKAWESFEEYVAQLLGLSRTSSSGSKFHDPGDAVTRGRHDQFPLYAEAKFTTRASFSLKLRDLRRYADTALETGRRFVLPLRFWPKGDAGPEDYLVLGLHDFVEMTQTPPIPQHPLLTLEEEALLTEVAELVHPAPARMRFLTLIDKLRTTRVP